MASSHQAIRLSPSRLFTTPGRIAIIASIALHAVLISVVMRIVPTSIELEENERTEVVWLYDWPLQEAPAAAVEEPATSDSASERSEAVDSPEAVDQQAPADRQEPVGQEEPVDQAELDDPADTTDAQDELAPRTVEEPAAADPSALEVDQTDEGLLRGVDLEGARRRALDRLREEGPSFSRGDPDEEGQPGDQSAAWAQLFEGQGGSSRRPAGMVPQRARTRTGRAIAEFCNALTGGFSIMGLVSLCASQSEGRSPFYALRPDYLKKLPYCYDVPLADGFFGADGATTATHCVLVTEEERALVEEHGIAALPR